MSQVLLSMKKEYYSQLEYASKSDLDITNWIHWYLKAINIALNTIQPVTEKSKFWRTHAKKILTPSQIKVLNKMWELPELLSNGINYKKYMSISCVSRTTAHREIQRLIEYKILRVIDKISPKKLRYTIPTSIEV